MLEKLREAAAQLNLNVMSKAVGQDSHFVALFCNDFVISGEGYQCFGKVESGQTLDDLALRQASKVLNTLQYSLLLDSKKGQLPHGGFKSFRDKKEIEKFLFSLNLSGVVPDVTTSQEFFECLARRAEFEKKVIAELKTLSNVVGLTFDESRL